MVINATNIGRKINGLGQYSLYLSKYILQTREDFKVYINKDALVHFTPDEQKKLYVVDRKLSPDYGFKGHLRRLIWANKFVKSPIFNTSQLELSFFNKNQIITVHDLIPLHFPKLHKKQYLFFRYLLPAVLKRVHTIITVSEHTKEQLIEFYNLDSKKIKVIYNGIKHHHYEKRLKENYILYVGRSSETKNIKRLIEAFCLAKKKYNLQEKLYLVGVNSHDIKTKCDDVIFLGYVENKTLYDLYHKARVFFFPSLYEGFGYPVLEAMQFGTPVITSNIASLPEVVGDAAILINPYNVEEMAEKLYGLINDEFMQQKLIEKGLKRAQKFSWESSVKEHITLLDKVANF